ncbi:MAG: type II toxin-antitoxin system RelE/ParE family toxin [Hyphomicrobiales bacterium]|nr:MAG: type II toxin-antitoxin system RelE/ParE family toxin [Hyphomicrobiales bacterium]
MANFEVRKTSRYEHWFRRLRDRTAQGKINIRALRLELGNFGDVRSVGGQVSELRVDHGPGYRIYFTRIGSVIILLLCGGDKSSQQADIELAQRMVREREGYDDGP